MRAWAVLWLFSLGLLAIIAWTLWAALQPLIRFPY